MLLIMKSFFIILAICGHLSLKAQDDGTKYYFKELGWSITLPNSFSITDSNIAKQYQQKGIALIEESNDVKMGDLNDLKDLITANKNKFNYFNATIRLYDLKKEGDYLEASDSVKRTVYRSFVNLPKVDLDSFSNTEIIDNVSFDKFSVIISINKKKYMTMVLLAKLYKGYDFGITYLYLDDKTKMEIEKMLSDSKFNR